MPTGTSPSEPVALRRPRPGPPATPQDLRRAQYRDRVIRTELSRVRTAAVAWRNGLGTLLAGLVGFSLIKGRSDVSTLAGTAAVAVGILLLLALAAGAAGAFKLLRAAHGRPSVIPVEELPPEVVAQHIEALDAARNLRRGIVATTLCAGLLVSAVAITWYGPPRANPMLRLKTQENTQCGAVVRLGSGAVVLATAQGEQTIPLQAIQTIAPVAEC
ncbi:MAG: hypothetical protein ACRDTA_10620 [Pseudonocardiaceae bacterium]